MELQLSIKIWAAAICLMIGLVAGFVASVRQSIAIQSLLTEMKLVREALGKLPNQEGRLGRLEGFTQRRQRK